MSGRKQVTHSGSGGNRMVRFFKREIWHPEKRGGNATIALSLGVFAAAIVLLRKFGDRLAV